MPQSSQLILGVQRSFAVMLCLATSGLAGSTASPSFGLTFFDQGLACQLGSPCGSYPGVNVQNSPQLSYSDTFSLSSASTTSTFSGSIDGTLLHAFSATSFPSGGTFQGYTNAFSNADEYWFDTFNFMPGTYSINLVFDGTVAQNLPLGSLFDLKDAFSLVENGTIVPGNDYDGVVSTLYYPGSEQSIQLSFSSSTSVTLGGLLQVRNQIGTSDGSQAGGSLTIDDADTAYFTVTPLTDGAALTTASGETYASAPVATPEPWAPPFVAIGVMLLLTRCSISGTPATRFRACSEGR